MDNQIHGNNANAGLVEDLDIVRLGSENYNFYNPYLFYYTNEYNELYL